MAIEVLCVCGQFLKAKDESAGKRVKCPHCGAALLVPGSPGGIPAPGSSGPGDQIALTDDPIPFDAGSVGSVAVSDRSRPAAEASKPAPAPDRPAPLTSPDARYKVITHKDMGFTTRFDPARVEETLNRLAGEGWSMRSAVVVNVPSHAGPHDELVLILER